MLILTMPAPLGSQVRRFTLVNPDEAYDILGIEPGSADPPRHIVTTVGEIRSIRDILRTRDLYVPGKHKPLELVRVLGVTDQVVAFELVNQSGTVRFPGLLRFENGRLLINNVAVYALDPSTGYNPDEFVYITYFNPEETTLTS